ncbi:RNA-binding protein [Ornatilinea apprima]|uniref:RNA-binding protein n=1 Tax=Ornatilinea apprima TaxID=1134406 RepID=A0A0P6XA31_9CHLR|nr:RNA-binding protein [Ornatilinea apprima]KPL77060.1 RNA-binding protein [Ornatilinea apprima]
MNIYVGNLPYSVSEDDVRQAFEAFGEVASVSMIKDKMTGQPRGFGFVEMNDDGEAQAAIDALNGKDLKGRAMVVNAARPREERPMGGGGGRGGFGGGNRRPGGGGGFGGPGGGNRRPGGPGGQKPPRREW